MAPRLSLDTLDSGDIERAAEVLRLAADDLAHRAHGHAHGRIAS